MGADKQKLLYRFHTIEGRIEAIRELIEEDQPCLDILCQMYAVRKAIDQLEAVLVNHELSTCIHVGFSSKREEAFIAELVALYRLVGNR